MKKVLLAVAAMLSSVPAFAEDLPAGGPRIELRAGWDNASPVLTYTDDSGSQRLSAGRSGVTYGGEIGYDAVFGNGAFVGAYAGIEGSTNKECASDDTLRACLSAGRNITAGARVGYVVGGDSMLYVKGGYSNGQIRASLSGSEDALHMSRALNGFHVGAGGELGLTPHVYTKLEYTYTHYEAGKLELTDAVLRATVDRHQIVGGVGYRF